MHTYARMHARTHAHIPSEIMLHKEGWRLLNVTEYFDGRLEKSVMRRD